MPIASVLTVECPSTLVVTVREFKVTDENFLANPDSIRKGTNLIDVMNAITVKLEDPGHYSFLNQKVNWGKVLKGDIQEVLRKNRIATWGPDFFPNPQCPRCEQVTETNQFDLASLPIQKLPDTSIPHLENGTPLVCTLPRAGNKYSFKLLRGEDDKALNKIKHDSKDKRSSKVIRYRTLDVEGVDKNNWETWIEDLGGMDSSFIRDAYEAADCGVSQGDLQFTCEHCHNAWIDTLEFDRGFLFPKYRGRNSTRP